MLFYNKGDLGKMDLSSITKGILFRDFFNIIDSYRKKNYLYNYIFLSGDNNSSTFDIFSVENSDIMNELLIFLSRATSFPNYYNESSGKNFKNVFGEFLMSYKMSIPFEKYQKNSLIGKLLKTYLFERYAFIDHYIFLQSLKFVDYSENDLINFIEGFLSDFSKDEQYTFWLYLAKYQNPTKIMISRYFKYFSSDKKIAKNLYEFSSNLSKCDYIIFNKIKGLVKNDFCA